MMIKKGQSGAGGPRILSTCQNRYRRNDAHGVTCSLFNFGGIVFFQWHAMKRTRQLLGEVQFGRGV
jgi:hypothetical protein